MEVVASREIVNAWARSLELTWSFPREVPAVNRSNTTPRVHVGTGNELRKDGRNNSVAKGATSMFTRHGIYNLIAQPWLSEPVLQRLNRQDTTQWNI